MAGQQATCWLRTPPSPVNPSLEPYWILAADYKGRYYNSGFPPARHQSATRSALSIAQHSARRLCRCRTRPIQCTGAAARRPLADHPLYSPAEPRNRADCLFRSACCRRHSQERTDGSRALSTSCSLALRPSLPIPAALVADVSKCPKMAPRGREAGAGLAGDCLWGPKARKPSG